MHVAGVALVPDAADAHLKGVISVQSSCHPRQQALPFHPAHQKASSNRSTCSPEVLQFSPFVTHDNMLCCYISTSKGGPRQLCRLACGLPRSSSCRPVPNSCACDAPCALGCVMVRLYLFRPSGTGGGCASPCSVFHGRLRPNSSVALHLNGGPSWHGRHGCGCCWSCGARKGSEQDVASWGSSAHLVRTGRWGLRRRCLPLRRSNSRWPACMFCVLRTYVDYGTRHKL